jgi:mRNA interferase MazF
MEYGDIYSVEIPASNGREQAGTRPAIVVQTSKAHLPTVLIVPLTSKLAALDFTGTFRIIPDDDNNLNTDSVALVFQLRAIDRKRLKGKIGHLTDDYVKKLQTRLKFLLQL